MWHANDGIDRPDSVMDPAPIYYASSVCQSCSQYSVIQVPVQVPVLESQVPVPVPMSQVQVQVPVLQLQVAVPVQVLENGTRGTHVFFSFSNSSIFVVYRIKQYLICTKSERGPSNHHFVIEFVPN